MTPQFVSAQNITTLEKLFVDPAHKQLATAFLDAFLPFKTAELDGQYFNFMRTFHAVGTYQDEVFIKLEDTQGEKRVVELSLIALQLGKTSGYFTADEDYPYRIKDTVPTHYAGRRFNCLCFFQFSIDPIGSCHSIRDYRFQKPPYSIRFDTFELPKFTLAEEDLQTDRDHWLYWLCHDKIPKAWEGQLGFFANWDNWDEDWRDTYKRRAQWIIERKERTLKEIKNLDPRYLDEPAPYASWNWLYLKKQIGVLPKREIKPEMLDLYALKGQVSSYAFKLFRGWSANCKAKYPDLNLSIESEQFLPSDLEQIVRASIIEVFHYDAYYRRACKVDYGASYLEGHLQGLLGRHWYFEYVFKQSEDFKTCMALRSLSAWLQIEDVHSLKIDAIYDEVLRSKVNISDMDTMIDKVDLKNKEGELVEANKGRGKVHTAIENLVHSYVNRLSKVTAEDFMPKVSEIIPIAVFEQLIADNQSLFLE